MYFHPDERILILIDGVSLNATHKALGFDIDFRKLLELFRSKGRLIKANFYTTIFEQQEYSSVRPLVDWLQYNGFTLITKPAREFVDDEGRRRYRGSMHVEMAVDALRLSPTVDHVVMFASEGALSAAAAALQDLGKRVTVVSTLLMRPQMVADELRRQADQFVELADLEPLIGRARLPRREVVADTPADEEAIDTPSGRREAVVMQSTARPITAVVKTTRSRTRSET